MYSVIVTDTESIYSSIMNKLCARYGHEFTWEIKSKQMGRKEREAAVVLIGIHYRHTSTAMYN